MQNFIITGTSGIGKTYLEDLLEKNYRFHPLVKYMDRPPRPAEVGDPRVGFLSKAEFETLKQADEFAFTLEYNGNNYGWKKSEIASNRDKNLTLGVTLESLKNIFDSLKDFCPVLLTLKPEKLTLLEKRLRKRENFDKLSSLDKKMVSEKINSRLELARNELATIKTYEEIVKAHNGEVFYIEDDSSLTTSVIPFILSMTKKS